MAIRNGEYRVSFNVGFSEYDDDGNPINYPDLSVNSIILKIREEREVELYDLYHAGVLTEVEYNQKRIEVLDGIKKALEVYINIEANRLEALIAIEEEEEQKAIDEQMPLLIV